MNREIQIPKDLYDKIKRFIESRPELGYLNVEEWTRDAMRRLKERLTLDIALGGLHQLEG